MINLVQESSKFLRSFLNSTTMLIHKREGKLVKDSLNYWLVALIFCLHKLLLKDL